MITRTALALSFAGLLATMGAAAPAAAMPAPALGAVASSDVVQVYHRGRPHRRARVTVHPQYYEANPHAAYPDYNYYYPYARGFGDTSNAIRGNLRGCSVDLGYGRYESCDK